MLLSRFTRRQGLARPLLYLPTGSHLLHLRGSSVYKHPCTASKIREITEVTRTPFVPELLLHLITPNCYLWTARLEACPFEDPFWAFFWPGGQALCRYVLDYPYVCKNKRVLDIGSGGGSAVITALKCGAEYVVANDIDSVAINAINLNMERNFDSGLITEARKKLAFSQDDILPKSKEVDTHLSRYFQTLRKRLPSVSQLPIVNQLFDVIFIGDLFYDEEIAQRLVMLILAFRRFSPLTTIYVGDPGRHAFLKYLSSLPIDRIAEYELPKTSTDENYGFSSASVYRLS